MAKSENQKLKLFYLLQILREQTDENHGLTMEEVRRQLAARDVKADRKTLYQDFEDLRQLGYDVLGERDGKIYRYRLMSREFELAELKLLVDSVQAAKFISEKKSREIIGKLEKQVSRYDAQKLHRQVFLAGSHKSSAKNILYNVDVLHDAIEKDRQVTFSYYRWNLKKKLEPRRAGCLYRVSPLALMWDDENYYLVAVDESGTRKHYRVDKMKDLTCLDSRREGEARLTPAERAAYAEKFFNMFSGQSMHVQLRVKNELVGAMLDRFGRNIPIMTDTDGYFSTTVEVVMSAQFLGWIFSLEDVRITGPEEAVEMARQAARKQAALYE